MYLYRIKVISELDKNDSISRISLPNMETDGCTQTERDTEHVRERERETALVHNLLKAVTFMALTS